MGHSEKNKRQNTTVNVSLRNGVIEKLYLFTSVGGSKIDYHGYNLNDDGTYVYDQKDMDVSPSGTPKEQKGFPVMGLTADSMKRTVTGFILKQNENYRFDLKIDGKEVSYKDFCNSLEKSEMLLQAKGIALTGGYAAATSNQPQSEIEKFGTPGAKAVFSKIKELSKNGTASLSDADKTQIEKLSAIYKDVVVNLTGGIQIIQGRHESKFGSNYTCFDISLSELSKIESPNQTVNLVNNNAKTTGKTL